MRKKIFRHVIAFAVSIAAAAALTVPAASSTSYETVEDNNYGKYSYVSKLNVIYRVDMKKRSFKKIKTFKGVTNIHYISYRKGYLYLVLNKYKGSDMACDYIYRMKTNGKSLKKLAVGSQPAIMGGKIYYLAGLRHGSGGDAYTTVRGINKMSLNGSGKKRLLTGTNVTDLACASGRIRYKTSDNIYKVSALNTDGSASTLNINWDGNSPIIHSSTDKLLLEYPSSTYQQGLSESGKSLVAKINDNGYLSRGYRSLGFMNGCGFYRSTTLSSGRVTGTLYMFKTGENAKGKKVKYLKNGFPMDVLAVNKGSIVLAQTYNGGGNKNAAISVMKTNGKGYRVVSKYFQW